jgi:hypothetical protein
LPECDSPCLLPIQLILPCLPSIARRSRTGYTAVAMAHIPLPDGLPGITGGLAFRPETAKPMREGIG